MAYTNHRSLIVWQKAMLLVKAIYDVTRTFPPYEQFGLASQMQRAAVSIPSNIAEGHGRDASKDEDRFWQIAAGSACELDTQLEISAMNGYITMDTKGMLQNQTEEVLKLIYGFRKSLKSKS